MIRKISFVFTFLIGIFALLLTVRGTYGVPNSTDLNKQEWKQSGPFELSPERGRFALTYSVVEDKSVFFSTDIARFTTPDLGYKNGNYVSLFAPAVSFVAIPGYVIGKFFGASQVGAYTTSGLFALLNTFLIYLLVKKLKNNSLLGLVCATIFLFASPAFAYSTVLYQHHISTFLVLASLYLTLSYDSLLSLSVVWFLIALAIPVDYPNLFFMLPIGLYNFFRVVKLKYFADQPKISIDVLKSLTIISAVLPLMFFLWFNKTSYGNPLQLSGTVASVAEIDSNGQPTTPKSITSSEDAEKYLNPEKQEKSAVGFFKTRNMTNNLYVLLLSPDRGMLYFAPISLLMLISFLILIKHDDNFLSLIVAVIVANITLYSMWGDPWGGWAFGARYLIPSYALIAILSSYVLDKFKKNYLAIVLFLIISAFSIYINTAGALSSIANPPQVQILTLEKITGMRQRYSFDRNIENLKTSSRSFVYQTYLSDKISSWNFFLVISSILIANTTLLMTMYVLNNRKTK